MFERLLNDSLSEYTQSVKGHGRQQSIVPSIEGTGAQNRPGRSTSCEYMTGSSTDSRQAHIRQILEIETFVKKVECTLLVHMLGLPLKLNYCFFCPREKKILR